MTGTTNHRILLGITGGIAAYKSPDLVRRLRERGSSVRVVMTRAATRFITPLTLQAVSGHPVHTRLLDESAEAAMGHIELARWAERILVAPASADFLSRLVQGRADDLLCALCLATTAPVSVAPAMNRQMWAAAATRANVLTLLDRGVRFLGPDEGEQACGETGPGRMLAPEALAGQLLTPPGGALQGLRVLVTAGPTYEAIDPVRYLTNHSSGKMGYAVAQAAVESGAGVTLISGPTRLAPPPGLEFISVISAEDMAHEVMQRAKTCDIVIAVAAVADYRPAHAATRKMKKTAADLALTLTPTTDIVARVAALDAPPFVAGFAAETENLAENARGKLARKGLDLIAANDVSVPGSGFGSDENALTAFWPGGSRDLGRKAKALLAKDLVDLIAERFHARHPA